MRVLLPAYRSRGNVKPLLQLVEQSLGFCAEMWVFTSPEFAELQPGDGVPLVPARVWQ